MMTANPKFLEKLSRKEYRKVFLRESVTNWIVYQLRALREQRGWSQAKTAEESGKRQSAIARNESPEYGNWNIATLLDLANAFDVALEVRFVGWPEFIRRNEEFGKSLEVDSFSLHQFALTPAPKHAPSLWDSYVSMSLSEFYTQHALAHETPTRGTLGYLTPSPLVQSRSPGAYEERKEPLAPLRQTVGTFGEKMPEQHRWN